MKKTELHNCEMCNGFHVQIGKPLYHYQNKLLCSSCITTMMMQNGQAVKLSPYEVGQLKGVSA